MQLTLTPAIISSVLLASSVCAAPTAENTAPKLVPRSCSVAFPSQIYRLVQRTATVSSGQTLDVRALSTVGGGREETEIGFTGIPESATGCQLELFFPSRPPPPRGGGQPPIVRKEGSSRINVWSLEGDVSASDTWDSAPAKALSMGEMDIKVEGDETAPTTITISSVECSPSLNFRIGIASESDEGYMGFWQENPPTTQPAGFRLTHDC